MVMMTTMMTALMVIIVVQCCSCFFIVVVVSACPAFAVCTAKTQFYPSMMHEVDRTLENNDGTHRIQHGSEIPAHLS